MITRQQRECALATLPPIEIARFLYLRNGLDFDEDLAAHLRDGFVLARPWCFMMFRAVELEDGRHAWMINSAVGDDLKELLAFLPFELPCMAFYRRNDKRLRVYSFERITRLVNRNTYRKLRLYPFKNLEA